MRRAGGAGGRGKELGWGGGGVIVAATPGYGAAPRSRVTPRLGCLKGSSWSLG